MSKTKAKHYNSKLARKIYFDANDITKTAGIGPHAKWFCQNPDCKSIQFVSDLEIHHLIPRAVAPSLTYTASNMVLLCQTCHREIEQNQERRVKSPHHYKQITFCYYCGSAIEFKRYRLGTVSFHPECFLNFVKTPEFIDFIEGLQDDNTD